MTDSTMPLAPRVSTLRTLRLPARVAFYLEASIIVCFLAASSAPTPLYGLYQQRWGFSALTVTVVFAVYAVAVLAALLSVGSLSDHVGRRPVLLTALTLEAAALVVLITAAGVPELITGRVVQGLATGLAAGAVGAGMLDIDRAKGTVANAVAPVSGTAVGGLISGLWVQYLPAPSKLIYLTLLIIVAVQAAGVLIMRDTATRREGALASLWPRFDLPPAARGPLVVAAPALVAGWALGGFYGSLGPSLVRLVSGSDSLVLGGLVVFVLAGAGALAVWAMRNVAPGAVARIGTAALVVGVAGTLAAIATRSETAFFVAAAVAGLGFGGGLQGAIRTVLPFADAEHRAGVLSIIYLISYLALGLPAVVAGILVAHTGSLTATTNTYGVAVIALAVIAFAGLTRSARNRTSTPAETTAPLLCPERAFPGACAL